MSIFCSSIPVPARHWWVPAHHTYAAVRWQHRNGWSQRPTTTINFNCTINEFNLFRSNGSPACQPTTARVWSLSIARSYIFNSAAVVLGDSFIGSSALRRRARRGMCMEFPCLHSWLWDAVSVSEPLTHEPVSLGCKFYMSKKVVGCRGGSRNVEGCLEFSNCQKFSFKFSNCQFPEFLFSHVHISNFPNCNFSNFQNFKCIIHFKLQNFDFQRFQIVKFLKFKNMGIKKHKD